jgi:Ca2+-binding RTX toxin-like protein
MSEVAMRRFSRPAVSARAVVVATLVGASIAVVAPSASALTSCFIESGTHHAIAAASDIDNGLRLRANAGNLEANGVICGSLAAIDSVTADMSSRSSGEVAFDLGGGALGPGFTDEADGSSEIEFTVIGQSSIGRIRVDGSAGNDNVTIGQNGVGQLNLNATADGDAPDVDVTFGTIPFEVSVDGKEGNDHISANGIVDGISPYANQAHLNGGAGTNTLVGGTGSDAFDVRTEAVSTGSDAVSGGAGFDRLFIATDSTSLTSSFSLDDVANDGVGCPGTACEGDNIGSDVEAVLGSAAAETLSGTENSDALFGGGGKDVIRGLGGADSLDCSGGTASGGSGADYITANAGCKRVSGGGGRDQVAFSNASKGVTVTLDNVANDGQAGALMNVRDDVENIAGSQFRDTLVGNDKRNLLQGWSGSDTLIGGGGNDRLEGYKGSDTLTGGAGDDLLLGGAGDDALDGGDGTDDCRPQAGGGSTINCE